MPTTDRFVGGHPIAGRELSGPAYASTDLFRDRPWVVTPTSNSDPDAVAAVMGLARVCGARPVRLDAAAHDVLFAQLSHVPQLVASALAGTLTKLSGAETALAGAGIRDTTRLADSDPQLWAEIVSANAAPVAAGLRTVTHDLARLADALEAVSDSGEGSDRGDRPAADAVRSLVERGRAGRAMLPGKHGGAPVAVQPIQVVVPDSPGALAELLAAVARERVNLEDLRVEHAPGQPLGLAELLVAPTAAGRLAEALRGAGWTVTGEPAG